MNDSYPKEYPGCLSKAREVLRQAMRDTDVQNVTFLEFQEEVTQALVFCVVCQQRVAGAVMHTRNLTCCRLWLCILCCCQWPFVTRHIHRHVLLVCTAAHPGPAAGLHWPPLCRCARGDGGASGQGSSEHHWVVKRQPLVLYIQALYVNPHSLAYSFLRLGLISVYSSIKCFATTNSTDATKAKKCCVPAAWQHKMTEAAAVVCHRLPERRTVNMCTQLLLLNPQTILCSLVWPLITGYPAACM